MSAATAFEVGRLYEPIKAIADTLTASQKDIFVKLPGLAAYYPMGIRNQSGHAVEHSGTGSNLLQVGTCPTDFDGNSYAHLGNGTNYLSVASQYAITGLETWISSSVRGLTIGGWFMVDSAPAAQGGFMGKYGVVTNYGYAMRWDSANIPGFFMSGNGSNVLFVGAPASTIGVWHFLVGRFMPSTEVAIFVDGDKSVLTAAIPASIFASTQAFEVGRYANDNTRTLHCKARDVFICASALSDALIEEIRVTSAP